ncbi:MAG: sortase domain-bontaining protein [Kineosporiaceae bacterium]
MVIVALAAVVGLASCTTGGGAATGVTLRSTPEATSATSATGTVASPDPTRPPLSPETDAAPPVSVSVPAVGIETGLVPLGVDPDSGELTPPDFGVGGWWRSGSEPGEPGPAVLAGHVSSREGPDVFHTLVDTPVGADVFVQREDGSRLRFVVTRVEQHPKDAFPTQAVYGDTSAPTLRLITCGGVYDREVRSHRDNIVVFADLAPGA